MAGDKKDLAVQTVGAAEIFRVFTACPTDPRTLLLDVRDRKHYARPPGHIAGAYCIRLSSNGQVLLGGRMREQGRGMICTMLALEALLPPPPPLQLCISPLPF